MMLLCKCCVCNFLSGTMIQNREEKSRGKRHDCVFWGLALVVVFICVSIFFRNKIKTKIMIEKKAEKQKQNREKYLGEEGKMRPMNSQQHKISPRKSDRKLRIVIGKEEGTIDFSLSLPLFE